MSASVPCSQPLSQACTPIVDALRSRVEQNYAPFHTPGHKRGQGTPQRLQDLLGATVFQADLPELPDLDNLFVPQGIIHTAQTLAAEAFGAEATWFLVNGSTCGLMAAILATCHPGDRILVPRNVHQSVISGLILSGAMPVFVEPDYNPQLDLIYSITPEAVAAALERYPDTKAVLMVYPTYHGICGDIGAIAEIAHQHGIPLLVDEAHGPHFAFHPNLPLSALAAGADLTVQSTHKVLSALTQAAMLHVQGDFIDRDRLRQALALVQSTSPSYLLLASLDAARQQMALHGQSLMAQTLELADLASTQISQIPGLSVLTPPSSSPSPGFVALDPTRLTVTVTGLGLTGFAADEILDQQLNVTAEFPSLHHLTFIISLGNTPADIHHLIQACQTLAQNLPTPKLHSPTPNPQPPLPNPQPPLSPRQAFYASKETLPLAQACDRICAETVCPYPPGIPVLLPGEVISASALDYLQQVLAAGGVISGCADPMLSTLQVVRL